MKNRNRRCNTDPSLRRIALALMLSSGAMLAQAASWVTLVPDQAARVDIDRASIERDNDGKLRVWHRESYSPRRVQDSWAFSYASMKQLSELQCDKRQAAPLRRIYLDETGAEIKSEALDSRDTQPIVPDTVLEKVFRHACRPPKKAEAKTEPPKPEPPPPAEEKAPKRKKKGQKDEEGAPPPPKPPAPWTYEGKLGAAHWGKLAPEYATCASGSRQSPIDLRGAIGADLPPIRFAWMTVPLAITDNGHELRIDASGGGKIVADGEDFEFQHFSFHLPAEEMINGKRAPMGVQFVHRSASGRYAILAVPLMEGKENRLVRTLLNALPLEQGKTTRQPATRIDPGELIPLKRDYLTYIGSLTTPPCSEGVLWLVMKHAVTVSKEQIADFAKVHKNNARPIQPANGRIIKESRAAPTGKK